MDHKRKTDFTMPYKSSGIIISGTQYDRRQKLTPFQKAEIFHRYMTEAVSQRQLAREYGVSRRLITFIVNPESEERNKELLRENKAKACINMTGRNIPKIYATTVVTNRDYFKKVKSY